jgi:hypothetical protein
MLYILSIYMGPVAHQVDYYQAIQSILCCAYITTITVIFITKLAFVFSFPSLNCLFLGLPAEF